MKRFQFAILSLILAIFSLNTTFGYTQTSQYPEIGKPMPDFKIKNTKIPGSTKAKDFSIKTLRGKYVILDFWNKGCGSCIAAFPKIDKLQKQYGDKLQFLMVGEQDKKGEIGPLYEKLAQRFHLDLATAFDSAYIKKVMPPIGYPYYIWIDANGIVKSISGGGIDVGAIEKFLADQPFSFEDASFAAVSEIPPYDSRKPAFVKGNGGELESFLFRTVVVPWLPTMPVNGFQDDVEKIKTVFNGTLQGKMSLISLCRYAYTGKVYYSNWHHQELYKTLFPRPVMEVKDKSFFEVTAFSPENWYYYSLTVPVEKASPDLLLNRVRQDLKTIFGYEYHIEKREMPCWILTCTEATKNRIATKGGAVLTDENETFKKLQNHPWHVVFNTIFAEFLQSGFNISTKDPLFDQTNIASDYKVDINLDCVFRDFNSVKNEIEKQGFLLTKSTRLMDVIVITDVVNQQ